MKKRIPLKKILNMSFFLISTVLIAFLWHENNNLKAELIKSKQKLKAYIKKKEKLKELYEEHEKLKKQYSKLSKLLFNGENESVVYTEISEFISSLAVKHRLSNIFISKLRPRKYNSFLELRVRLKAFTEDLSNLLKFLYSLETNKRKILRIEYISIRKEKRLQNSNFTLELYIATLWKAWK